MKSVTALVFASTLAWSAAARADSFSLNGAFSTDGVFTCLRSLACAGSGTNTVTLGTGANTATLTFNGVDTTVAIGNKATLVSLGSFSTSGAAGFTFPTRPNPNTPILRFDFKIHHTSPVEDTNSKTLWFGPGGKSNLPLLIGTDHTSFPLSLTSPGHNYPAFVYSLSPFPFRIAGQGMTDMTARVGVVPEPATFVLVGGGLVSVIAARRRRRQLAR
jgi:PEP-CTERM motif